MSKDKVIDFIFAILLFTLDAFKVFIGKCVPLIFKSKKSVKGEIALVTGGGSGFGRLLAIELSRLGARVVIWDVNSQGNEETCAMVRKTGGTINSYIVDVSDKDRVYETAKKVEDEVGKVTILVNNAGIAHNDYFLNSSDALLAKVMGVNAMAHFWTLKAFLPNMVENNHGHVVGVSSIAGLVGIQQLSAYCSSKFAVVGLMESIKMELLETGKTGVKTTVVCPFFSPTSIFQVKYDGVIPMVKPEHVVRDIVNGILTNQELVTVPSYGICLAIFKFISTNEAMQRVGKCVVGPAMLKTVQVKKVFPEQN